MVVHTHVESLLSKFHFVLTLDHEPLDNSVKERALVPDWSVFLVLFLIIVSARRFLLESVGQSHEVLGRLRDEVIEQLENHPAQRDVGDGHVKEDAGAVVGHDVTASLRVSLVSKVTSQPLFLGNIWPFVAFGFVCVSALF